MAATLCNCEEKSASKQARVREGPIWYTISMIVFSCLWTTMTVKWNSSLSLMLFLKCILKSGHKYWEIHMMFQFALNESQSIFFPVPFFIYKIMLAWLLGIHKFRVNNIPTQHSCSPWYRSPTKPELCPRSLRKRMEIWLLQLRRTRPLIKTDSLASMKVSRPPVSSTVTCSPASTLTFSTYKRKDHDLSPH